MIDRICGQILHPLRSMTETVVSHRPPFLEAHGLLRDQVMTWTAPFPMDRLRFSNIPVVVSLPESDLIPNAVRLGLGRLLSEI